MHRTTRSVLVAASCAALTATACQQGDPAPVDPPVQTVPATTEETAEQTEVAPTTEEAAAPTTEEPTTEELEETTEAEETGGDAAAPGVPEGLPETIVEEEPVWTATGRFLGVVGEVAAFEKEAGTDGITIAGVGADGSQAWETTVPTPSAIEPGTQSEPFAMGALHHYVIGWVGDSSSTGERIFVVTTLDPATGEEVAGGQEGLEGAVRVTEAASLDEMWVETGSGSTIVHIPLDGGEQITIGEGSWGEHPVLPITRSLGVLMDGDGQTLQLVDQDLEPLGEERACSWAPGPGQPFVWNVSGNGVWAAPEAGLINLETGEVTCHSETEMYIHPQGVADDGTVIGATSTDEGAQGMVLKRVDGTVTVDEDATAAASAILGDVVIFATDAGHSAHRIKDL